MFARLDARRRGVNSLTATEAIKSSIPLMVGILVGELTYYPPIYPYERWTVREHQSRKYAYDHGALILLIPSASSYR